MGNPLHKNRLQGRETRRVSIATQRGDVPWSGGSTLEQNEETRGNAEFGAYLKKVREGRRLSLDAVEELSAGFPEKVTKSHLSRIENGLALPTFPRLMAMSHIYGVPIASLAERYEIDLRRGMTPVDLGGKTDEEVLKEVDALRLSGSYNEALVRLLTLIDQRHDGEPVNPASGDERIIDLRIRVANCLMQLGRYEFSKTICEELLGFTNINRAQRLSTVLHFSICCYRLGRYTVALMALDQVAAELDLPETPRRVAADLELIRGNVFLAVGSPEKATIHLEKARAGYDALGNLLESCRAGLVLGEVLIELGRLDEADGRIRSELDRCQLNGLEGQKALALSHLAVSSFRRGDSAAAEALALKSNVIARPIEHHALVFRNCFYLWEIAKQRGDAPAVKLNERTLRTYLGRIESKLPEAECFREHIGRGQS
jgi:tetratricopeptide (TPR) repeat protein